MQRCDSVSSGWSSSDDEPPPGYRSRASRGQRTLHQPKPSTTNQQQPPQAAAPSSSSGSALSSLYTSDSAAQQATCAPVLTKYLQQQRVEEEPRVVAARVTEPSKSAPTAAPLKPRQPQQQPQSEASKPVAAGAKRKKAKRKKRVTVNLSRCKYDIVRECVEAMGWAVDTDDEGLSAFASLVNPEKKEKETTAPAWTPAGSGNGGATSSLAVGQLPDPVALLNAMVQSERCQIIWSDVSVLTQSVSRLKSWQRVNHFPSMNLICRKVLLGKQLSRMHSLFPEVYNFFPLSYSARSDLNQIATQCRQFRWKKTWILKPNAGCQGAGILLTKQPDKLIPSLPHDDYVVQLYIPRPMLIEGKKFDMRIYVLVLSVIDLKIMIFDDGLIRMCTRDYVRPRANNLKHTNMHLTNYAVNKKSGDFAFGGAGSGESGFKDDGDASKGFKRDFAFFKSFIEAQFGEEGHRRIWQKIEKAIVLTILSAYHQIRHAYCACNPNYKNTDCRTCFELLGFDVLLDDRGNPYVIEVNHSPSFATESAIDHRIKRRLITDTLKHVNPFLIDVKRASDHQYRKHVASKEQDLDLLLSGTGYRPIYPPAALQRRDERAAERKRAKELAEQQQQQAAAAASDDSEDDDDSQPEVAPISTPTDPQQTAAQTPPGAAIPADEPASVSMEGETEEREEPGALADAGQAGSERDGDDEDEEEVDEAPEQLETAEQLQQLYDSILTATASTLPGQTTLRSQRSALSMSSSMKEPAAPPRVPPAASAGRRATVTSDVSTAAGSGIAAARRATRSSR